MGVSVWWTALEPLWKLISGDLHYEKTGFVFLITDEKQIWLDTLRALQLLVIANDI